MFPVFFFDVFPRFKDLPKFHEQDNFVQAECLNDCDFETFSKLFEYLFGEDQGRYIIEIEKDNFDKVKEILNKSSVHYDELGIVTEKDIIIDSKSKVTTDELSASNKTWLTKYMSK